MKTLDTLTERITLDNAGNLEILPRQRIMGTCGKVSTVIHYKDEERPIRLSPETVKKLKEMLGFIVLLIPLLALAAPTHWVEKGLNVHRVWNADGLMISCQQQKLTHRTNLAEQYFTSHSFLCPTQTTGLRLYQGNNGTLWLVGASSMTWSNGIVTSNWQAGDSLQWATFTSGGNTGAGVFVSDGERHQLINAAVFGVRWSTNGFQSACENDDDRTTLIFWYRSGALTNGLPWFIGAWASLCPGELKQVKPPVPVDVIWRLMGTDKCFGCGVPCWLPSWPEPEGRLTLKASPSRSVSFQGAPSSIYSVECTEDGIHWRPAVVVLTDEEGRGSFIMGNQSSRLYRTRLLASATMNEKEASLAVQDLIEFEREQ